MQAIIVQLIIPNFIKYLVPFLISNRMIPAANIAYNDHAQQKLVTSPALNVVRKKNINK